MKRFAIIMVLACVGCSSIKHEHVVALQTAILNERQAVTVRPGFEDVVTRKRKAQDDAIAAMLSATK